MLNATRTFCQTCATSFHHGETSFSKKRPRRHLIEDSPDPLEVTDDGRPKTRRVNPARLAIRLGPELVSEMEAYIVPGAKMPNFTVRKDFQERYSVDRRHIYDYFHSRGKHLLRCRILRKSYQFSKACELLKKTSTPI